MASDASEPEAAPEDPSTAESMPTPEAAHEAAPEAAPDAAPTTVLVQAKMDRDSSTLPSQLAIASSPLGARGGLGALPPLPPLKSSLPPLTASQAADEEVEAARLEAVKAARQAMADKEAATASGSMRPPTDDESDEEEGSTGEPPSTAKAELVDSAKASETSNTAPPASSSPAPQKTHDARPEAEAMHGGSLEAPEVARESEAMSKVVTKSCVTPEAPLEADVTPEVAQNAAPEVAPEMPPKAVANEGGTRALASQLPVASSPLGVRVGLGALPPLPASRGSLPPLGGARALPPLPSSRHE